MNTQMGEAEASKPSHGRTLFWSAIGVLAVALLVYPMVQLSLPSLDGIREGVPFLKTKAPAEQTPPSTCACQATTHGEVVSDCCCDYQTVNALNGGVLHPLLSGLVSKPFFSYFKVKLWCDCPFWPDDGMCHLRDCSVCECDEDEVPLTFKKGGSIGVGSDGGAQCTEDPKGVVDRTLEQEGFQGWTENDNPWTADDESSDDDMVYVDLRINPEKYTGYKGVSATRIWEAIYNENCFKEGLSDTCAERRVFYRLISGLHASIAVHIAKHYLLDEEAGMWGTNLDIYKERIHAYPERLQNLYFTFLFVLRAATKAADFLANAEYSTGSAAEDAETAALVQQLVYNERLMQACPVPFDEATMWRGDDGPALKAQLAGHFRNISAIMDCVSCEKCRLWGKLQILGLATSMKIIFSEGTGSKLILQRNEVIALVNSLARLSESLNSAVEMGAAIHGGGSKNELTGGAPIFSDVFASNQNT